MVEPTGGEIERIAPIHPTGPSGRDKSRQTGRESARGAVNGQLAPHNHAEPDLPISGPLRNFGSKLVAAGRCLDPELVAA